MIEPNTRLMIWSEVSFAMIIIVFAYGLSSFIPKIIPLISYLIIWLNLL